MRLSTVLSTALVAILAVVPLAVGQSSTTGALAGTVSDSGGEILPGSSIVAVHVPTGTKYTQIAGDGGRFNFPFVKVGGPYSVTAALDGFRAQTSDDVFVRLGDKARIDFKLTLEAVSEEITVFADSNPIISSTTIGTASNVSEEVIANLPTIERGFADFARTNPLVAVQGTGGEGSAITVAGRNNRYNSIQIDGSVNNDLFGLAASGTPGGQSETQPISIDAIKEIQVVIAPYDVRQGGFSGGGINAITRTGTNEFAGSVYLYSRDDSLVGDGEDLAPLGTFEEDQYGFRLGGPISQDKIFFFVNAEVSGVDRPTGYSIDGGSGAQFLDGDAVAEAERFRQITLDLYGYDIGGFSQVITNTDSDKIFARMDFNLNASNNLTVRHNYVSAERLVLRPNAFAYEFPSHGYNFENETNSTVFQLNSVISDSMFNEGRIAFQSISDRRGPPPGSEFPYVRIDRVNGTSRDFEAGTEQFSTQNSLDQDILEIHDDFTFFKGDHEITIGTHNELFTMENLFIQQAFGAYRFFDLDAYEAGLAYRYDISFSNDDQPKDIFDIYQLGFYAGDNWRMRDNLTLVYGLRVDMPVYPDTPQSNPLTIEYFGVSTSNTPSEDPIIQPRFGFNWDIDGDASSQLRGGVGLFYGRLPFVWLSNNYARNGIEQSTIRCNQCLSDGIPFNPDPFNQPHDIGGARTQEVNLVDPDFELPSLWRANLGYDRKLPWLGLVGSVELVISEVNKDIKYQNLNIVQTGETLAFDGRPIYEEIDGPFTGAYYISNTSEGDTTNFAVKIERPYSNGFYGFLAYAYGDSTVVSEGTSSRAVSNWQFNEAADPNNPGLSTSDFQVEHRFTSSVSYEFNRGTDWPTTTSFFYSHQAGRPLTLTMQTSFDLYPSVNGEPFFSNDLMYIPAGADDVVLSNGTWEELDAFLNAAGFTERGVIAGRNEGTQPWTHSLDFHIGQQIPVGHGNLELTFDILNFMNLIDEGSGKVKYASFGSFAPVQYEGTTDDGRVMYALNSVVTSGNEIWSIDNLRSRWRAKLGLRYNF